MVTVAARTRLSAREGRRCRNRLVHRRPIRLPGPSAIYRQLVSEQRCAQARLSVVNATASSWSSVSSFPDTFGSTSGSLAKCAARKLSAKAVRKREQSGARRTVCGDSSGSGSCCSCETCRSTTPAFWRCNNVKLFGRRWRNHRVSGTQWLRQVIDHEDDRGAHRHDVRRDSVQRSFHCR